MSRLWLDLETRCEIDLKAHGVHRYAEQAEITLSAYAVDDGPVKVIDCAPGGDPGWRSGVQKLLDDASEIVAHKAGFDRTILEARGLHSPIPKWRCTMAKARSVALPGGLDKLGEVLNLPANLRKNKEGRRLVLLFCKPRPKNSTTRWATRETHPDDWAKYVLYAGSDILAMRAVDRVVPNWNYTGAELALWHLDHLINDRGFYVDLDLANAAIAAVDGEQELMAARVNEITEGAVGAATERDKMLAYLLAEYGVKLPNFQAATIEARLSVDADLPAEVVELLNLRLQASTISVKKFNALIRSVNSDGRVRGTTEFCGAARTRRWAGRLFQVQNMTRPNISQAAIEMWINALKAGAGAIVGDVMAGVSNTVRGVIISPPGKKLVVADLANIEGRDQAWLAREQWKLDAFRAYDTIIPGEFDAKGKPKRAGADLYNLAYAKSFGVPVESVSDDQRQKGKVQELSLGYEGGVGAFATFAMNYRVDLGDMARQAWDILPGDLKGEAIDFYHWTSEQGNSTHGMSMEVFVVCDTFKRAWRRAHPMIASYWKELEKIVKFAILNPGETFTARKIKVRRDGAWLRLGLPSGGALCYPQPMLEDGQITYMGAHQYTRQWTRLSTYGGKLFENVCQGVARDVMAGAMPRVEAAGYQIVMHAHDELVCEAPDSPEFNGNHLGGLLAVGEPWTEGMPLAAAGFESYRYRKG